MILSPLIPPEIIPGRKTGVVKDSPGEEHQGEENERSHKRYNGRWMIICGGYLQMRNTSDKC